MSVHRFDDYGPSGVCEKCGEFRLGAPAACVPLRVETKLEPAPTPRTDGEEFLDSWGIRVVTADFARQLERALRDEGKMRDQAVANEAAMLIRLRNVEAERDKLREALERVVYYDCSPETAHHPRWVAARAALATEEET
jgi:hypothetical protein